MLITSLLYERATELLIVFSFFFSPTNARTDLQGNKVLRLILTSDLSLKLSRIYLCGFHLVDRIPF